MLKNLKEQDLHTTKLVDGWGSTEKVNKITLTLNVYIMFKKEI